MTDPNLRSIIHERLGPYALGRKSNYVCVRGEGGGGGGSWNGPWIGSSRLKALKLPNANPVFHICTGAPRRKHTRAKLRTEPPDRHHLQQQPPKVTALRTLTIQHTLERRWTSTVWTASIIQQELQCATPGRPDPQPSRHKAKW